MKEFFILIRSIFSVVVLVFIGYYVYNHVFSSSDVKCDDVQVQELVRNIYEDNIKNSTNYLLSNIAKNLPEIDTIQDIRTQSIDKDLDKKTCKANLIFKDKTQTQLIYEVQTQNDKIYVELDMQSLQSLLMQNMFNIINENKNKNKQK